MFGRLYSQKRTIAIGKTNIGGDSGNTLLIVGPCSVESQMKELGVLQ